MILPHETDHYAKAGGPRQNHACRLRGDLSFRSTAHPKENIDQAGRENIDQAGKFFFGLNACISFMQESGHSTLIEGIVIPSITL